MTLTNSMIDLKKDNFHGNTKETPITAKQTQRTSPVSLTWNFAVNGKLASSHGVGII